MNTKFIFPIIFMVVGGIFYAFGGHVPVLPDAWFRTTFLTGKAFMAGGGLWLLALAMLVSAESISTALVKASRDLRSPIYELKHTLIQLGTDAGKLSREFLDEYLEQGLVLRGVINMMGNALDEDLYKKIPDLLKKLEVPASVDKAYRYVQTAKDFREELLKLYVTHDGLTGPALIEKVEAFLAAYDAATESQKAANAAAAETQRITGEAQTAQGAADAAHAEKLRALNAFSA